MEETLTFEVALEFIKKNYDDYYQSVGPTEIENIFNGGQNLNLQNAQYIKFSEEIIALTRILAFLSSLYSAISSASKIKFARPTADDKLRAEIIRYVKEKKGITMEQDDPLLSDKNLEKGIDFLVPPPPPKFNYVYKGN